MTVSRPPVIQTILLWFVLEIIAAWQVRTPDGNSLLMGWMRSMVRPITWTAQQTGRFVVDAGLGAGDLRHVIIDNRLLRLEVETLKTRALLLEEDLSTLRDADRLLSESPAFARDAVIARCTYRDLAAGSMEIRTASEVHLPRDTPAVTAGGLVGRVIRSEGSRHWLQLMTHHAAAAAVQFSETNVEGLVLGTGGHELRVAYVPRQARLERGAILITSGGDGVYPPGIPAAMVVRVRETDDPFLQIGAEPTADLQTTRIVMLLPFWSAASSGDGG